MFRLMSALVCVLLLLGPGAALGRETVAHTPFGHSAVITSACEGMHLQSRVGQGMAIHRARAACAQHGASGAVGEPEAARSEGVEGVALGQNFPNPFNPTTVIEHTVREGVHARLTVYDSSGRLVRTLVDEASMEGGPRAAAWDGTDDAGRPLSSGVYFARLEAAGESVTRKMVLLK
jgi:hypothetical protein